MPFQTKIPSARRLTFRWSQMDPHILKIDENESESTPVSHFDNFS